MQTRTSWSGNGREMLLLLQHTHYFLLLHCSRTDEGWRTWHIRLQSVICCANSIPAFWLRARPALKPRPVSVAAPAVWPAQSLGLPLLMRHPGCGHFREGPAKDPFRWNIWFLISKTLHTCAFYHSSEREGDERREGRGKKKGKTFRTESLFGSCNFLLVFLFFLFLFFFWLAPIPDVFLPSL